MKNLILVLSTVLFCLFTLNIKAQMEWPTMPVDSVSKKISYSEVVYVDSTASKDQLFSRSREWFAKTYKSANSVIQMEDKESGKIVGKAIMQVYHKALGANFESGYINYTITIYVKDGRYKYEFSDFYHTGQYIDGHRIQDYGACENMIHTEENPVGINKQKFFKYYLIQLDENTKLLVENLKQAMNISAPANSIDNW